MSAPHSSVELSLFSQRPAFTAIAVTIFALATIWLVAPRSPAAAWLIAGVAGALLIRRVRLEDRGFGWPDLRRALLAWWPAYVGCALILAALTRWRTVTGATLLGAVAYLAACVIQQLIYQHLVCAPLTAEFGPNAKAQWSSALLFSLVHLPNPVLAPVTLIWGAAAWSLFRRERSLWAVAILQYLLSGIAYAIIPYAWHHVFRVGPRYFAGL
jgi:hypothetical protein